LRQGEPALLIRETRISVSDSGVAITCDLFTNTTSLGAKENCAKMAVSVKFFRESINAIGGASINMTAINSAPYFDLSTESRFERLGSGGAIVRFSETTSKIITIERDKNADAFVSPRLDFDALPFRSVHQISMKPKRCHLTPLRILYFGAS
jgi:hypothetical protein